ncbi:uncharacterized protein PV09_03300 [Verruconis gallopava]|uniref:Uncharacterized protein n=1 Tax=Verruconis gallopava TaxID=253628 RepID=A0A0D2AGU3_9PEZI|nr:uncharacterized protein PV09_03300 [Verruconis gallopava]KIW06138.1 hypothetical protein PV09_03300 [Verruconis gallopava]
MNEPELCHYREATKDQIKFVLVRCKTIQDLTQESGKHLVWHVMPHTLFTPNCPSRTFTQYRCSRNRRKHVLHSQPGKCLMARLLSKENRVKVVITMMTATLPMAIPVMRP